MSEDHEGMKLVTRRTNEPIEIRSGYQALHRAAKEAGLSFRDDNVRIVELTAEIVALVVDPDHLHPATDEVPR